MLQRFLCKTFSLKLCSSQKNIYFKPALQYHSCKQCGFRLFSNHKVSVLRNNYERTLFRGRNLFLTNIRYYTSQVDAQKKNGHIEALKDNAEVIVPKKINVKLKISDLKRLLSLAEPEKWTLAGKLINLFYRSKEILFLIYNIQII